MKRRLPVWRARYDAPHVRVWTIVLSSSHASNRAVPEANIAKFGVKVALGPDLASLETMASDVSYNTKLEPTFRRGRI